MAADQLEMTSMAKTCSAICELGANKIASLLEIRDLGVQNLVKLLRDTHWGFDWRHASGGQGCRVVRRLLHNSLVGVAADAARR